MLDRPFSAALNHLLRREAWARARLRPFAGRSARLALPPLPGIDLTVAEDGTLHGGTVAAPDVRISLPEHAPLRFLGRPGEALAAARLEGSADFAEALGFVFRNLRWDVEEDLARLLGDVPARRLVQAGGALLAWQKDALGRLGSNVREYLEEEQAQVLRQAQWQAHRDQVAAAATATAALERRLAGLEG